MSQPKRWGMVANDWNGEDAGLAPMADGEWVKHSDYAAIAAENERLRKAGDAMYHTAQQDGTGLWLHKSFQDWKAAKEGGSK